MRQEKITLAIVAKPNLDRLERMLPKVLPYVDRAVIIIGERHKESERYLKSLAPKVEGYYYPWHDNFADSWNAYLSKIKDGWVLIVDDDEVPSEDLLKNLDMYVEKSEMGKKFCCVEFRCNPISEGQDLGPCNYYRQIFFRYSPGMTYKGGTKTGCHQYLVGYQGAAIRSDFVYYHIKSLKDEYQNASRNYFIYGIWKHGSADGEQREEWHELKDILGKVYPDVKSFPDLDRKLIVGDIHSDLKDWMVRWYTSVKTHPDFNEMRALVSYYFKYLHPEEKPETFEL